MTDLYRPASTQSQTTRGARVHLRGALMALGITLLAASCATGTTTVTENALDQSGDVAPASADDAPSNDPGAAAPATQTNSGDEAETYAEANDQLWAGPDWLDLPAGFTVTWGYPTEGDLDGIVQGDLAADLSSEDAVAHVRGLLLDQGFTPINDTPEWVMAGNAAGEFIQVGTSGYGDDRTWNVTFFTPENAAERGYTLTLDVLQVDLDGRVFELDGRCSDNAEGFSGSTGDSFVSINGIAPDYGIFLTITDPDGVEWSSLGGDITEITPAGFRMDSSVINDNAEFAEVSFTATCN